ncbi:hypothetical protein GE21DRAFT_1307890 [Neurospora crassa]|nr:hypothetical protein B8B20.310 [imported] - Neurospora crassa [Neurospora crassa]KHE85273.1 hypothetical protein GE21DRAFT_1307890 [Neurospora crassa]
MAGSSQRQQSPYSKTIKYMSILVIATTITGRDVPGLLTPRSSSGNGPVWQIIRPYSPAPSSSAVSPPESSRTRKDYTPLYVLDWMKDSGTEAAGLSKHVGLSEYNGEADAGSPVSDNYDPRAVIAGANAAGVDTGPTPSPTHTPLHSSESQEEFLLPVFTEHGHSGNRSKAGTCASDSPELVFESVAPSAWLTTTMKP